MGVLWPAYEEISDGAARNKIFGKGKKKYTDWRQVFHLGRDPFLISQIPRKRIRFP